MRVLLKISNYWFVCIIQILGWVCTNAQTIDFNKEIRLENRSTNIRDIFIFNDSLLLCGQTGADSSGFAGIFLLSMDTLGNIIHSQYFHDPYLADDMLQEGREPILINESGNILLTGEFFNSRDIFLMEVNAFMETIMYHQYAYDYLIMYSEDITETGDGYYISGFVQTQNFDADVFIQKVDKLGNKIWSKTYGIPSKDETSRAAIWEEDGLTVLISESYDPTPTIKNGSRYWIRFMHIDTSGKILRDWKEEVTGYEGWSGTCLKYRDDYIYTTNTIGEETNFGPITGGQVVRRDGNFNLVWRKKYGEPDSQYSGLGDLIFSGDNCLYATGQNVDSGRPYNSARIMKIGLDGNVLWEVRDTGISLPNGQSLNFMEGITMKSCNSIFSVGYTYKNPGFYEGLILKVSGDRCIDTLCTTTKIEDLIRAESQGMLIYPNPATSCIQIRLSKELQNSAEIRIYDNLGVLRKFVSIYGLTCELDISSLPNGVYWIVAESSGKLLATKKLTKTDQ